MKLINSVDRPSEFKTCEPPDEEVIEKYVKSFLDLMVLAMLNDKPSYGYKIIATIHIEFGILLSPASLYPLLHTLENNKLIDSNVDGGKTMYNLTKKGSEAFNRKFVAFARSNQIINSFVKSHAKI